MASNNDASDNGGSNKNASDNDNSSKAASNNASSSVAPPAASNSAKASSSGLRPRVNSKSRNGRDNSDNARDRGRNDARNRRWYQRTIGVIRVVFVAVEAATVATVWV